MYDKITLPTLINLLAEKTGKQKKQCEDFLREIFNILTETLSAGENVKIKSIGTFKVIDVEARKSVNVNTGEDIEIPGHKKVVFIPSKELAEDVNSPFAMFETVEINDTADIEPSIKGKAPQATKKELQPIEEYKDPLTEKSPEPIEEETNPLTEDAVEQIEEETDSLTEDAAEPIEEETNSLTEDVAEPIEEEMDPLTEDAAEPIEEEMDPLTEDVAEPIEEETGALTEDVVVPEEDMATSLNEVDVQQTAETDASIINTNISLEDNKVPDEGEIFDEDQPKRKSRKFIWGFLAGIICMALVAVISYLFLADKFNALVIRKTEATPTEKMIPEPAVVPSDSIADSTKEDTLSATETIAETADDKITVDGTEDVAPTRPSDEKVYDTISKTRYLTTMAKAHYGNFNLWPYIYEENKAILGHPDRIRPGTKVEIPPLSKYGIDPNNPDDIRKAKQKGVEIYARYNK